MARTRTKKKTASSTDTSTATNTAKQDTTSDLEINETATITSTSTATFVPRPGGDNFTARDFEILSENENMRYMPYSKSNKVGHAVIVKNEKGEKIALQYAIPQGDKEKAPEVQQLLNIHEITRFGHTRYMAETPEHTVMYAKRYLQAKVKDNEKATEEEMDIAYFSPSEGGEKEPFWGGGNKEVPLFSDDLPPAMAKDLKKELADIKKK